MQESGFMALKDRGNRRTAFLTLVLFMRQDSEEKGARIDCVYIDGLYRNLIYS